MAQARRLHVPLVRRGELPLDPAQARHARGALRLADGTEVEVFDDAGNVATGVLTSAGPHAAAVLVTSLPEAGAGSRDAFRWGVASAVPKGDRADWMVEKLSELGAAHFIPLATARSVVHPEGRGKRDRWQRLATESAKQSRRPGVMRIGELTKLEDAVGSAHGWGCILSTGSDARPLWRAAEECFGQLLQSGHTDRDALPFTLFVGPEGGWTEQELAAAREAGLTPARLTTTILRVETAAVAAAAVVATLQAQLIYQQPPATEGAESP